MNTPATAPLTYRVTPSSYARSSEQRAAILAGELGFGQIVVHDAVGGFDRAG